MQRLTWSLGLKSRSKLSHPESCFKNSCSQNQTFINHQGQQLQPVVTSLQGPENGGGRYELYSRVRRTGSLLRWHACRDSWQGQGQEHAKEWHQERGVSVSYLCLLVSFVTWEKLSENQSISGAWGTRLNETEFLPGVGRNGKRITVESLFLKAAILAKSKPKHRHTPTEMRSNPTPHLAYTSCILEVDILSLLSLPISFTQEFNFSSVLIIHYNYT